MSTETFTITTTAGTAIQCNESAGPNDTCEVHCEVENGKPSTVDCGTAGTCIIDCDDKKCFEDTVMNATRTNNLYLNNYNGDQCTKNSILHLPIGGNATINGTGTTEGGPLRGMSIYSHNTDHIWVYCVDASIDDSIKDECKNTNIYAADAQYLYFKIAGEYESDSTNVIECPTNSNLDITTCIIDASEAELMEKTDIYAPNGYPQGVLFYGNDNVQSTTQLICNAGTTTATTEYLGFANGKCFLTKEPTTQPTTYLPTKTPTTNSQMPYTSTNIKTSNHNPTSLYSSYISTNLLSTSDSKTTYLPSLSSMMIAIFNDPKELDNSMIIVIVLSIVICCLLGFVLFGYRRFKAYKRRSSDDIDIKNDYEQDIIINVTQPLFINSVKQKSIQLEMVDNGRSLNIEGNVNNRTDNVNIAKQNDHDFVDVHDAGLNANSTVGVNVNYNMDNINIIHNDDIVVGDDEITEGHHNNLNNGEMVIMGEDEIIEGDNDNLNNGNTLK